MKSRSKAVRSLILIAFALTSWLPASLVAPAAVSAATAVDWPQYLANPQLTGASNETILAGTDAPNLAPKWTFKTGGMIAASATVVAGVAYVGSWDGFEYALNAATGSLLWKTSLGITNAPQCSPPSIGLSSIPAVVNGVVYVGGGDGNWYALDAGSGAVLWSINIGSPASGYYNWASPLIVGNSAYIGVASLGDCPLVRGALLRVDLTTHAVVASAYLVPAGQVGGGIWTSPAYDAGTNTVFVTTGTLNQPTQSMSEAMVALDATSLAIKSYWQIPQSTMNADSDWGTSPILFADQNGRQLVAGVNKNGFLYAFLRSNVGAGPVWSDLVAVSGICPTCGDGSVASMAFANGTLFVPGGNTTINGVGYPGAIRAVDPASGAILWARGLASPVVPAIAYDNGMVFAGVGNYLEVLDAATGNVLESYRMGGTTYAPPSVSNGIVYIGAGDGNEYAFATTTPIVPPADPSCPSGWSCQDVGNPSPAGTETVSAGAWSVSAGGTGLASGSDQFRLLSQNVVGDTQITARLTAQSGSSSIAGVMVRQSNDPASPFYALVRTGGGQIKVISRLAFGGSVQTVTTSSPALPVYFMVQRVGDRLIPGISTNGSTYSLVPGGSATVVLPTSTMVGLTAASGFSGSSAASGFDSISIGAVGATPNPPPSPSPCPSGWACTDIGNPTVVGDQTLSAGTWTVLGAGTGNAAYADQLHFVYQGFSADATLTARVTTQQNTASAQAGLEFRGDTTAGAFYYGAFVTPSKGIQVLYRTSAGVRTATLVTASGAAPQYLEISRWQTTYTTFTSPDGVNWSPIVGSSMSFGPAGSVAGGIAVSSGSTTTGATDTLDTVTAVGSASPPPTQCPAGWTCADVGNPIPSGSQYIAGSSWTVEGGGGDIWGTADSFRLISEPLASDGTVSARIDSQSNTSAWAKAGVMMRATSDPGSPYFAVFMTPANGIAVQWRTAQGGSSSQVAMAGTPPAWFEVSRSGGTFTGYTSVDGLTWTAIPNASVNLGLSGSSVLAGIAVTSHNTGAVSIATSDTVAVASTAPPPPNACPTGWSCGDIGSVGVVGGQSLTSGTWTIQGGGGDIWSTSDSFHFVSQPIATDVSLSAQLVSQTNASPWAKAGLMVRATIDPGSPYYAAFVTPGNGIAVQWRTAQGGASAQTLLAGSPPIYLKIGRAAGTYSTYTSPDGVTWTLVPGSAINVGLTGASLAGLAITSHNWGVLGSATLQSVNLKALPPLWLDGDIGAPALSGSASAASGVFSQTAGGTDIYGTADQFNLAYVTAAGDATVSAHVTAQTKPSSWAKAGPMIRATTSAGSPYYAAFVTPGNGIAVQWRKSSGGGTTQVVTSGTVPAYLLVTRSGNTFSAFSSPDGTSWTLIPGSTVTFTFAPSELLGLAATSHSASARETATYDTVTLANSAYVPANDFTLQTKPSSLPMPQGTQGWSVLSTAVKAGAAETIALTVSGAPAGLTATLNPASVTTGGSATLAISVGASVPPGVYALTVTATSPSVIHTSKVTVTVSAAPAALPTPWASASIGSPAIPGWASLTSGTFSLTGGGADIYSTSDQFEYVYQNLTSLASISGQVASETNSSTWAKAGLMVRSTTDPTSAYYGVFATPGNGVVVQWRSVAGGGTTQLKFTGTVPVWIRIGLAGGTYTAYTSPDGTTWTPLAGSGQTLSLGSSFTAGMALTSHNPNATCTATFTGIALT